MATINSAELHRIGDGPVATVYSGHRAGVRVALKVFPKRLDKRTLAAFNKEQAKLSAMRNVTSILPVDGVDELDTGEPAVRMELCTQSLAAAVDRVGPLPPADVAVLGRSVAEALAAAHRAGVVHGGMSPHNILFRGTGEPVLADFGVTLRHAFARDPLYAIEFLPPETLRTGVVNESTDLYGLGAVLHYALSGRSPHPGRLGEQPGERVLRILGEPVPAINAPDVPLAMSTLVARLLATDPARRPNDSSKVAEQLAAMLPNTPRRQPPEDFDDFDGPQQPVPPPPPARQPPPAYPPPQPFPTPPEDFDDFATPYGGRPVPPAPTSLPPPAAIRGPVVQGLVPQTPAAPASVVSSPAPPAPVAQAPATPALTPQAPIPPAPGPQTPAVHAPVVSPPAPPAPIGQAPATSALAAQVPPAQPTPPQTPPVQTPPVQAPPVQASGPQTSAAPAPVVSPPARLHPNAQAPVAEARATEVPAAEPPATQPSAAEAPVTETPARQVPAAPAPVVSPSARLHPNARSPLAEARATEAPAAQAPTTQTPAAKALTTQTPPAEAPATKAPTPQVPAIQALAVSPPAPPAPAPATEPPATQAPASSPPIPAAEPPKPTPHDQPSTSHPPSEAPDPTAQLRAPRREPLRPTTNEDQTSTSTPDQTEAPSQPAWSDFPSTPVPASPDRTDEPQPAWSDFTSSAPSFAPPTEPERRKPRYDLLAGAGLLLAVVAFVLLLVLRDEPEELIPNSRVPDTAPPPSDVEVELSRPTDLIDRVELNWRSTESELDFAVVVAAEGEKEPKVLLAKRNQSMTVPVQPGRKYCFQVQATNGNDTYESDPVPLRGATCRK